MKKHTIIIYRYTGNQGFFYIPKNWCEECDLLINLVKDILKKHGIEDQVELIIRPWWLWCWLPLIQFNSFHAPQLIINGKLVSAGIVPEETAILEALKGAP